MLIDSHCHLDNEKFSDDLELVLERSAAAGVGQILTIGTGDGPPALDSAIRIADSHEQVLATVGVHPHDAAKCTARTFDGLRALAGHPRVVGFGEIGLDYHYDFSPREVQKEVFVEQLKIAREAGLPIIIHTREAWNDTISLLQAHWKGPGIFHCFTGDPPQAQQALDMDFHLAFGGVLTFRAADAVRESARMTPDHRILLETDAPYLAPIPFRGKRNEPSMMVESARKLAEVRGTALEEIARLTTSNFNQLFLQTRNRNDYTGDAHGN